MTVLAFPTGSGQFNSPMVLDAKALALTCEGNFRTHAAPSSSLSWTQYSNDVVTENDSICPVSPG